MRVVSSKTVFNFLLVAAMAIGLAINPGTAYAQAKVAVVNTQKIMSESLAAKSIQGQIDKHRKSFQEEFSKLERDLLEKEKALVELRAKLPPEEFEVKGKEYKDEVQRIQKLVQQRRQSLEQAAGTALNDMRGKILEIVSDIASKEKYDIVLARQNVIWTQKEMDITDTVMARLDKELKQIDLKVSTN